MENIADPSSRLYCGDDDEFSEEVSPWEVCSLEKRSNEILTEKEIHDYTQRDETLMKVITLVYKNEKFLTLVFFLLRT